MNVDLVVGKKGLFLRVCLKYNANVAIVYNYFILFCATASGNSSSGHPQHRGGYNLTAAQKDLK